MENILFNNNYYINIVYTTLDLQEHTTQMVKLVATTRGWQVQVSALNHNHQSLVLTIFGWLHEFCFSIPIYPNSNPRMGCTYSYILLLLSSMSSSAYFFFLVGLGLSALNL